VPPQPKRRTATAYTVFMQSKCAGWCRHVEYSYNNGHLHEVVSVCSCSIFLHIFTTCCVMFFCVSYMKTAMGLVWSQLRARRNSFRIVYSCAFVSRTFTSICHPQWLDLMAEKLS
jgi:hypothetical protein